ncbi:hypothetical protein [Methylobacterium haplocladii]|uniref:Uncharacterized protein n=1 Tax=Methylobacterium haplocladii TaxID=1176176 RepID=A0A512IQI1_9HYPH|nr:hypothetical protein [Methylobacterium haplocladii]GEO99940.1 hypothetical protein MHA02_23280 [Methylobacterium haplocladii]GJD86209.1 hypothetical protein HPGCJGGD_4108 [Methylobacterium haplocladii]GLS59654.1 hypothetical protein GCM10007887_23230 [Methylobacterium haplocladii]
MSRVLRFLRIWTLLSLPVGLLLGKLLKANHQAATRPVDRRQDDRTETSSASAKKYCSNYRDENSGRLGGPEVRKSIRGAPP